MSSHCRPQIRPTSTLITYQTSVSQKKQTSNKKWQDMQRMITKKKLQKRPKTLGKKWKHKINQTMILRKHQTKQHKNTIHFTSNTKKPSIVTCLSFLAPISFKVKFHPFIAIWASLATLVKSRPCKQRELSLLVHDKSAWKFDYLLCGLNVSTL